MSWVIHLAFFLAGFASGIVFCIWLFGEFDDDYTYADYFEVDE